MDKVEMAGVAGNGVGNAGEMALRLKNQSSLTLMALG
jgi:hypothetical protein